MSVRGTQSEINLFIAGDSTTGLNPPSPRTGAKVSWADVFGRHLRKARIVYHNEAKPGYSLRDFLNRGALEGILKKAGRGDILLACHGHLEEAPLVRRNERARGCLPGFGEEVHRVYDPYFGRHETVHTFGWYIRQHYELCRAHGVQVIYLSPAVRNKWKEAMVRRTSSTGKARIINQVCREMGAPFLDFALITEKILNAIGQEHSQILYIPRDETHTNVHGALLYARLLAESLVEQFPEQFLPLIDRRLIRRQTTSFRLGQMNLTGQDSKDRPAAKKSSYGDSAEA